MNAVSQASQVAAQVETPAAVVCARPQKRRAIKSAVKSAIAGVSKVIPDSIFRPAYDISFAAYRKGLRALYSRHILTARLGGSAKNLRRAQTVKKVMPYSLVGSSGLESTFDVAENTIVCNLPGAFVECGVARGGCSALLAMVAANENHGRKLWMFDSYQGLPDPTQEDFAEGADTTGSHVRPLPKGSCLGTRQEVESLLFNKFKLNRNAIVLVEGWFQDTLPIRRNEIGPIAVLRIDGDWYESTRCVLLNLFDQVPSGGWVIVDDYGTCSGCQKAVDEFLAERHIKAALVPDGRGGIAFQKS